MKEAFRRIQIKEWRYYYGGPWSIVGQLLNEIVMLTVFWFTAKAFVPDTNILGKDAVDYFTFIVIGETCLRTPSFFMTVFTRNLKNMAVEGTFEFSLLLPIRTQEYFIMNAFAGGLITFLRAGITLLVASGVFALGVRFQGLGFVLLLQLVSWPLFAGIGLTAVAVFLFFGRGETVILKGASFLVILGGAYFPIKVFPESLAAFLSSVSPFNILLDATRHALSSPFAIADLLQISLVLLIEGGIFFFAGHFLFGLSVKHFKKKGRPFVFIS